MPQLNQDYVFVPQRLLADLPANPAAIGVYALIARLFLIYQAPIPLSAADLQRYDPTLSYGAARGALQRLVALRWLRAHGGHKNHYLPTWGVIKGTLQPWRIDAPTLGRPAHVVTLRLDRRLLDVGLGKLVPHPSYPAQTSDRYLEQPIFCLRDVGAYAQVLSGQALAATPALWRYGLIRDGLAQPLSSAAELIALASQRTLTGDGAAPTEQGLRALGLEPPSAPPATTLGQPLFFVDQALIPDPISHVIPDLIPLGLEPERPSSAAACARSRVDAYPSRMAGTPGIPSESSDSSPKPAMRRREGGDDRSASQDIDREATQPETESADLLSAIHAFPSSVAELATMPADLVRRAIAYAQAEPGIESVTGWVVEALRRHRDEGWPIPGLPTKQRAAIGRDGPIDIEKYTSGVYGDLFRRGSDTSGLDKCSADQEGPAFVSPSAGALEPPPLEPAVHGEQFTHPQRALDEANASATDPKTESAEEALRNQVRAELMLRCDHRQRRVIKGLQVHVTSGITMIICATFADLAIVQNELLGALQRMLAGLGAPRKLVFTTRAGWEARRDVAENAFSHPIL
jgi:hypothetical protein